MQTIKEIIGNFTDCMYLIYCKTDINWQWLSEKILITQRQKKK